MKYGGQNNMKKASGIKESTIVRNAEIKEQVAMVKNKEFEAMRERLPEILKKKYDEVCENLSQKSEDISPLEIRQWLRSPRSNLFNEIQRRRTCNYI